MTILLHRCHLFLPLPLLFFAFPGFGSASDAPKVSADQAKLDAIIAEHPEAAEGPAPPRNVDGLPLVKPPYGVVTALDIAKGTKVWQVVHGETPDAIKNHPLLKGVTVPRTGQSVSSVQGR